MIKKYDISTLNTDKFGEVTACRKTPLLINFREGKTSRISLDALVKKSPEIPVTVRIYGNERKTTPRDQWTSYCEYTSMSLEKYAQKIYDGSVVSQALYLALFEIGETAIADDFRPFLNEISSATGLEKQSNNDINLWVAPGGHLEPLHFDGDDGTIIQLVGNKTVTLVSPKHSKNLYPFPWWKSGMPSTFSRVNLENIDHKKYPEATQALNAAIQVSLNPGQALYIPAGWWHQVLSESTTKSVISINRFWKTQHRNLWRDRPRVAVTATLSNLLLKLRL